MAELKVGDKIATGREFGKGSLIYTIERETPTMWVCENGKRFLKDGLKVVGPGRWGPYSGRVPTDHDVMSVRVESANTRLRKIEATPANIDAAEAFIAACAEAAK